MDDYIEINDVEQFKKLKIEHKKLIINIVDDDSNIDSLIPEWVTEICHIAGNLPCELLHENINKIKYLTYKNNYDLSTEQIDYDDMFVSNFDNLPNKLFEFEINYYSGIINLPENLKILKINLSWESMELEINPYDKGSKLDILEVKFLDFDKNYDTYMPEIQNIFENFENFSGVLYINNNFYDITFDRYFKLPPKIIGLNFSKLFNTTNPIYIPLNIKYLNILDISNTSNKSSDEPIILNISNTLNISNIKSILTLNNIITYEDKRNLIITNKTIIDDNE